jgi:hypothetical protein
MNQRVDRKLADRAWEILYLHQKAGQFVPVAETDDSYSHFKRPRWDTIVGLSESFDLKTTGSQIHNQKAQIGQTWQVTQGNVADQTVQPAIGRTGNALRAIRRAGGAHELRLAGDAWDAVSAEISLVTAKADWLRTSINDLTSFGLDVGPGVEAQISIDPDSNYRIWQTDGTQSGGQYIQTSFKAGVGGWETLEIAVTWGAASGTMLTGTYDVFLSRDGAGSLGALPRTRIANDVPLHTVPERTVQQLVISNQSTGAYDVTTWWDNVSLSVGRALPSVPGDANLDGIVDITDLGLLATNWQGAASWLGGDFTGDGFVDISDLGELATNWQTTAGARDLEQALASVGLMPDSRVPEPTTPSAVLIALAAITGYRGRRSRRS